jgi:antitoxin HicB
MTTQTPVDIEREVERHMALPYRIELVASEDGGYFVRIPDLPGCMSQGETVEEAMEMIRDAQRGWLEVTLENGQPIPLPAGTAGYSGKFTLRVPKRVHRALAEAADAEGVSVNLFAASVLAMAVGERAPSVSASTLPPLTRNASHKGNNQLMDR